MKDVYELSQLVDYDQVLKSLRTARGLSTTVDLFELLNKSGLTDEDARDLLYPGEGEAANSKFRQVKRRLRLELIDHLTAEGAGTGKYDNYVDAVATASRMIGVIRMLSTQRAYRNIKRIAQSTFHAVKDYENIKINQELLEYLSYMNLGVDYNEALFLKYNELCAFYTEGVYELGRLEHDYRMVRNAIYAHRIPGVAVGEMALQASNRHLHLRTKYPKSSKLQSYLGSLIVEGYKLSGRFEEAIEASYTATEVLKRCKGTSRLSLEFQMHQRIDCLIKLRDFERGRVEIELAREACNAHSINGIKIAEYGLRLGLTTGHYQFAYESAVRYSYKVLGQYLTERHLQVWHIFEAYLNLLKKTERLEIAESDHRLRRFRIGRFLNDVPDFARNKMGMNIQILIVQILHFAAQGKFGRITDRTEALDRYCSRYLRNDENLRNNCFFRIILIASQASFNYQVTKRKTAATYKRMVSPEAVLNARLAQDELVPYEVLYEIFLESMEQRSTKARAQRRD